MTRAMQVGDTVRTLNNDLATVIKTWPQHISNGVEFQCVEIEIIRPDRERSSNKAGDRTAYEASNLTRVNCAITDAE